MDVNNRDKKERELARRLSRIFGDHFEEVMDLLGDPPNFTNLTPDYWERYSNDVRTALSVPINEIFYEQFEAQLEEFGLSIGDSTGSVEALNFVQRYMFDLVGGITDTTRNALQQEILSYIQNGDMTIEDLAKRLYRYYGPNRAEMIAITETTRAASEGENATMREVEKLTGNQYEPIWQTAADERVCDYCNPRNGKVVRKDDAPPAHPRCRCWRNHRKVGEGDEEYFDYGES